MGRTTAFSHFARLMRTALTPNASRVTRRDFLRGTAAAGAVAATALLPLRLDAAAPTVDVGIVGAGLAGLTCADQLRRNGVRAAVYEAAGRIGGRCASLRNFFPQQTAELGGEFIDNPHKTMLAYANQFGLQREDVTKAPGEVFYYFGGQHYPETVVVEGFRAFVPRMREDLRKLSSAPSADSFNLADVELDWMNLRDYLVSRGAGSLIRAVIEAAYEAEYGLAADRQSCLNFLLFIHADRRSKFTPFGISSDERWHIVNGNDAIVQGIANLIDNRIEFGMRLVKIDRTARGAVELTFRNGTQTVQKTHEAVVLSLPFTTLRQIEWGAGVNLPVWKRNAINLLGYGTNAKMMVGFNRRPWIEVGGTGTSYSNLNNHQTTWETNPIRAAADHAVLTDYSSGPRGARLDPSRVQQECALFLADLDRVFAGSFAAASRDRSGNFVAHLEHWPTNPNALGSYTCYLPGQFTTIAGNEGKPVDNIYFAGEHANSFYEWQGFMEGAALSGIDAAKQILSKAKK